MSAKKKVLLVVDDEPDSLKLFQLALRNQTVGFEVIPMLDGREVLNYLLACRGGSQPGQCLPFLILMDLKMPGISGIETLQQIRSLEVINRTPVVIYSASRNEEDILMSYQSGASSFIRKEIDYDTFSSQLLNIIEYWLLVNQHPF